MHRKINFVQAILDNFLWVLIILIALFFVWRAPGFLTGRNVVNLLLHASVLGLLAIGQSICLLSGNFDLSIEGNLQLGCMLAAWMMVPAGSGGGGGWVLSPFIVIPFILILGGLIGLANGLMVTRLDMNNFVVTMAMQMFLGGIALSISRGFDIVNIPSAFMWLGSGSIGTIPVQLFVTGFAFLIAHLFLSKSKFGRQLYAVGANKDAAYASGIDPKAVITKAYILNGIIVAVAGWMLLGRLGQATAKIGTGFTLTTMAACVIGGISSSGGSGSIVGALGGVLLLAVIENGLNLLQVSSFWVQGIQGFIILVALVIDAQKFRYQPRKLVLE